MRDIIEILLKHHVRASGKSTYPHTVALEMGKQKMQSEL